jgi:hypothetical protein
MKLKEFKDKEELINKELSGINVYYDVEFDEIDFENELFTFTKTEKDPEYGWYDIESHEVDFDLLEEMYPEILKGLISKIEGLK